MTLLDDPPVVAERAPAPPELRGREFSAWRLAGRLARRETRRRPGRTVLAALLIAAPVMAMTIGSVLIRTESGDWSERFERRFGDADIAVDPSSFGFTTEAEFVSLPAGTQTVDHLWVNTTIDTGDSEVAFAYGNVADVDLTDPAFGSPVEVVEGSGPQVGEIMLPAGLAASLEVAVGDEVTFDRPSGSWTLSGIGRVRDSYFTNAILIPGFGADRIADDFEQSITLYDLPTGTSVETTRQLAAELGGVTRFDDPYGGGEGLGRGMAWGWVAGVLALVAVGIVVTAAFATSARRQLVTIGQLAANGATAASIRRMLALQGTWTGVVGSLMGIGAGLAALPIARPVVEQHLVGHDLAAFRVGPVDLVAIAATATIAATIAAAVPARSAARIPVMSALAGRRPQGSLPTWLVPTGLLLLAVGLGLVAVASVGINGSYQGSGDDLWALLIVLGVVGVVFGMCCATPLAVERMSRLGRRMTLSWRLALRTLGRSRTRSSAVVAAIAVVVGGSVAAGAIVETAVRERAANWIPIVPADAVVIDVVVDAGMGGHATFDDVELDPVIDVEPLAPTPLSADVRGQILAIVPGGTIDTIRVATVDPPPYDTSTGDGIWPEAQGPRIADPALVDVLGLSAADVDLLESTGSLRPLGIWEFSHPEQFGDGYDFGTMLYQGPDGPIELNPTPATSPYRYDYAGYGSVLVTEAYARELGFDVVERGAVVRSPDALTVGQRDRLAALQTDLIGQPFDAFIEPGDPPRSSNGVTATDDGWSVTYDEPRYRAVDDHDVWIARLVILAAVLLLSLLVVSIGLSLAAAEGRDERNVLSVVGATPASMRRQASARGAVLALSGILLGIPTGFLPAWVLFSVLEVDSSISTEPLRFPWLVTAGLILLVPALVATVAWVASGVGQRFRPPTPSRRD